MIARRWPGPSARQRRVTLLELVDALEEELVDQGVLPAVQNGVCACGRDYWHCCPVFACGMRSCPSCARPRAPEAPQAPTRAASSSPIPVIDQAS